MDSNNNEMDTQDTESIRFAHGRVSEQQQQRRQSGMSIEEERERRASIQDIMHDPDLTPLERRQSIQSLMDGRRRSSRPFSASAGMSMAAAAAAAAADFEDSSDDENMHDSTNQQDMRRSDSTGSSSSTPTGGFPSHVIMMPPSDGRLERSASMSAFAAATANGGSATFDHQEQMMCLPCDTTAVDALSKLLEQARPPCTHYERHCSIVAPCCGLAFGCRICHDECPVLPTPLSQEPNKRRKSLPLTLEPDLEHHSIDRFAVNQVICRECFTKQDSKTNKCISCGIQFGKYHCDKCNLWMSNEEDPFHCDDCGFCRVGGRDKFRHCHDCGMCIDVQVFDEHNCKAGKYMSSCPVCQEDLFSSRFASHEMPCGHAIHWHCFKELTSYDTRCPVCKKTAETREQMEPTWSAMAAGISIQPVPPEMARLVTIICNDCEERDENRQWHFLGVQCRKCSSFNTVVEQITLMGPEAVGVGGSASSPAAQQTTRGGSPSQTLVSVPQSNVNYVSQPESMDES